MSARPWLLAIDTATATIIVAAGDTGGAVLAAESFEGRHRHSQELLPAVTRVVAAADLRLVELAGVVVGTGPGAFTGLRVGLATAKTLAHELGRPIVGVSTAEALLAGVDDAARLWLPSGTRDRILVRAGETPVVVHADDATAVTAGHADRPGGAGTDVAVDLDGRADEAASVRGRAAVAGLAASLLRLGAARLRAGEADDPERLVPTYAVAPRGAPAGVTGEEVAWSRDPR